MKDIKEALPILEPILNGLGKHFGNKFEFVLPKPKQTTEDGRFHYSSQTKDGRMLTSSTIYLKDEEGSVIGSLCINFDCSDLIQARSFIDSFIGDKQEEPVMYGSIDDLLTDLLMESVERIGMPPAQMTKEQKLECMRFLQEKGALEIKGGINKIAKFLGTTRSTVYNYINEINA